jgi:GNAT superfamily N-acetyltransferase
MMDDTRYSLREFRDADYPSWAALSNSLNPEILQSAETLRRTSEAVADPAAPPPRYVVEGRNTGDFLGIGTSYRNPYQNDPRRPWIGVQVRPDAWNQGIGSALYDALRAELIRQGATGLRCAYREERTGTAPFVAHRGFVERRRAWRSVLDVPTADVSSLRPLVDRLSRTGIEITTLSAEGWNDEGVLQRLHDLDNAAGADVPRIGAYTPISFDRFRQLYFGGKDPFPEGWFLAKAGDRFVGRSSIYREETQPDLLHQGFTGVRPEYRGRHVARALKLSAIAYAKGNGYARIETSNDSLNAPMWALNRGLGFRKAGTTVECECVFNPTAVP